MREELEQQLMDKFVFMEAKNVFSGEKLNFPKMCECGDGWYNIIHNLCNELNELYISNNVDPDEIFVTQIKEKYGGLSFYTNGLIEGGFEIINKYENISDETCELCGAKGETRGRGWISTLCDDCHNIIEKRREEYVNKVKEK